MERFLIYSKRAYLGIRWLINDCWSVKHGQGTEQDEPSRPPNMLVFDAILINLLVKFLSFSIDREWKLGNNKTKVNIDGPLRAEVTNEKYSSEGENDRLGFSFIIIAQNFFYIFDGYLYKSRSEIVVMRNPCRWHWTLNGRRGHRKFEYQNAG